MGFFNTLLTQGQAAGQVTSMNFREDINGLRAIAVVAVVLFHFGVIGFQGGFVGVDVFFVISGFLMTYQIIGKMENETFSIFHFYAGRARRIVPALLVLCVVLIIVGWFLLAPDAFKALGKHSLSSLLFVSNFAYWQEASYFDEAARSKWLLHTWSLSVEWQFYIIYPIAIVVMRSLSSLQYVRIAIVISALASFAISLIYSPIYYTATFYLIPFRAWEMLGGGDNIPVSNIVNTRPLARNGSTWIAAYLNICISV
ncbi:MAG: acyltransferase [Formivibrio sp.]|nr:acyltransferase [Formivibrio sp.]